MDFIDQFLTEYNKSRQKHYQSILYDWLTGAVLPLMSENGLWTAPSPAPLNADEFAAVLESVMEHESYKHQFLESGTNDGFWLVGHNGEVTRTQREL